MNLKQTIEKDIIISMKNKDKETLTVLRTIKEKVKLEIINNKKEENNDLYLDVINKQIKMLNASINEFEKANRMDLVDSYKNEIDILNKYMPKPLTDEELDNIINDVISKIGNDKTKFGLIMKEVTPIVKNRCDMSKLSLIIKNKLN